MAMNAPTPTMPDAASQQGKIIRPGQVQSLEFLPDDEKVRYENGIRNLWKIIESAPPESPDRAQALRKLSEVTQSLRLRMSKWRETKGAAGGSTAAPAAPTANVAAAAAASAPQPSMAGAMPSQPLPPQSQSLPQGSAGVTVGEPGQGIAAVGAGGASAGLPPGQQFSERVRNEAKNLQLAVPPQLRSRPHAEQAQWAFSQRQKYAVLVQRYETNQIMLGDFQAQVRNRQSSPNPYTPEEQQQVEQRIKTLREAASESQKVALQFKRYHEQARAQQQRQQQQQQTPQSAHQQPLQGPTAAPTPQQQQAMTQARTAPQMAAGVSQQSQAPGPPAGPIKPTMSGPAGLRPATGDQAPAQPNKVETADSMLIKEEEQQAPGEGEASQAASRQLGASIGQHAPHAGAAAAGSTANATPTSGDNANGIMPGGKANGAFSLSHPDAVSRAAQNQAVAAQGAHAHPTQAVPPPHGLQREQSHSGAIVNARPTARPLNVAPPVPVPLAPARPTLAGGPGVAGPMGQPAIQKHPGFVLEGEGERVLSKKKLEELVRQVTGGGAGGEAAEALDPDVEEVLLDVADEFVDNVVAAACRLAKLRQSPMLELRDLQMILERNYNIRVPGYASDELRTVKKIQPSPAWTQKMSAVQAAKVTGTKGDL